MKSETDHITTNQLAPTLGVKPNTIIRSLCVNGHYLGMKPRKLPNGRLLWSVADRDRLLHGEEMA
jgi:hypothetical protein